MGHTNSPVKAVDQYDLLGNYITTYASIIEARNQTNDNNISNVLSGLYNQSKGNVWKYTPTNK